MMTMSQAALLPAPSFEPTLAAAHAHLRAVRPAAYARTRNHLDGAVTRLSPYITHGFISIGEAIGNIHARTPLAPGHKLVFEFAWRAFFHHVWRHLGDAILSDLRPALPGVRYATDLPADLREGRTGVPVIDWAVRELYASGYLHNHARMWLASYLVHQRKVHWRAGADWMFAHLLDGDLACNHLSWQWVAGTFSHKPYLFNAENVARYAPGLDCRGTCIDKDYPALEHHARSAIAHGPEAGNHLTVEEPAMMHPETHARPDTLPQLAGLRVALVHPWSLGVRPDADVVIGLFPAAFHERQPWNERRRQFVLSRMRALCDHLHTGPADLLSNALRPATAVSALATHNPGYQAFLADHATHLAAPARFFPEPARLCTSFSRFWHAISPNITDFDAHVLRHAH
jgi:deoxyribodipyrimidine photo-lyase